MRSSRKYCTGFPCTLYTHPSVRRKVHEQKLQGGASNVLSCLDCSSQGRRGKTGVELCWKPGSREALVTSHVLAQLPQ